ncbi:MAG TPA: hypothetical protein VK249_24920 [Anaerolineales bacterium]|nr:hypothetical protein [Anaerolineales bacterium]
MSDNALEGRFSDRTQRLYLALLIFAAALLAGALTVIHNNSIRTVPIFLFLLFLGTGIMLALGMVRGVLAALLMISLWIAIKQLLGVWETLKLLDLLLELILVGLTFIFAGRYHDRLQAILKTYWESQNRLKQLDLEDKTTGLLKASIGSLRLNEEEERSVRYRRPFALMLIMVRPIPGSDWEAHERSELLRAVATGIKDTTRGTDIPFLAADDKIAVILPETEINGANKVVNNIINRMTGTHFVTPSGSSKFIHTRVQLRFGFAAFLGASATKISMMEAAESSLQRSLEINIGDLFQNLFIEWQTVGELSLPTPLFEEAIS